VDLPNDLRVALDGLVADVPPASLRRSFEGLSARYRAGHALGATDFVRGHEDAVAYAAYRLPATFAAVRAALSTVNQFRPDLLPRSVLDLGAGPGTASLAAGSVWPEIERVTLLERDRTMMEVGRQLTSGSDVPGIRGGIWKEAGLDAAAHLEPADLVIAAYVLGEIAPDAMHAAITDWWSRTTDLLVIVEPGTPRGFELIRRVRSDLIEAGGTVVAPCPHDLACPMAGSNWCHFSQRVPRSRPHRMAKGAQLSYEDEKFSYVAVSRFPGPRAVSRIVRHPQVRPGHIRLELCTDDGLQERTVTRRDKASFREARDAAWGDPWPAPNAETKREDFP
jgi:ribosomal protein RSM22 (predicted rRNA methylase)